MTVWVKVTGRNFAAIAKAKLSKKLKFLVMGNSFFCNRCDIDKFQLSRACADQFLNDGKENQTAEQRSLLKLRCLDEMHSKQKGLTPEAFNELFERVKKGLEAKAISVYCTSKDSVLECLHRNPNCSLNCQREMNEFVDCVDALRIRRVKQRIHEEKIRV